MEEPLSKKKLTRPQRGRAKRAIVTENSISIVGGGGEASAIAGRAASIGQQIGWIRGSDPSKGPAIGKSHDQEQLEERLRRLSGVAAVIRVGDIVARAIAEPARPIAANMGDDPAQALARILAGASPFFGLDARSGRFGDLHELGVLDPLIVTRLALQEAASAASLLTTVECVIARIPPDDPLYGYTPEWAAATREDPRV